MLPLFCALALAWPAAAWAGEASQWRLEAKTVLAPAPPPGVEPAPDPVPLGAVGAISFWAPNRGLLITGGTEAQGGIVPAGVYAYDGENWHQLASVCGGARGRIAWAGEDEFWTIADQRAGQVTGGGVNAGELEAISLCHFVGDEVVASYAMPLGEPDSYRRMDAAACLTPSDCWFGGEDGAPPNAGSFHLHWNGSEVSVIYDSSDHAVAGMAAFAGRFYEGLQIGADDTWQPGEEAAQPPVIRTIAANGATPLCALSGQASAFCDVFLFAEGHTLPVYPERTLPAALGGFALATNGAPLGTGATQLWAGADPLAKPPAGSGPGKVTLLRDTGGEWAQLLPAPNGSSLLPAGAALSVNDENGEGEAPAGAIAPEPGTSDAWLSLEERSGAGGAELALIEALTPAKSGEASARLIEVDRLPQPNEAVGGHGRAGPIACPAKGDCWMASEPAGDESGGWLFHLSGGPAVPEDTDPLFDGRDGVISYRPPDSGLQQTYPDGFAEDDSLANQRQEAAPPAPPPASGSGQPAAAKTAAKAKPLVEHTKSKFLHRRELVISFTLTADAHVQLLARRKGKVIAKTRDESLKPGKHTISLTLDPRRWPSRLQFEVKPLRTSSPGEGEEEGEEGA